MVAHDQCPHGRPHPGLCIAWMHRLVVFRLGESATAEFVPILKQQPRFRRPRFGEPQVVS